MTDQGLAARLATVGFFEGLSTEELATVASLAQVSEVPVGAVLAQEGGMPTKFYIVLDGHLTVHRAGTHLADLGPDDVFGEAGALQLQPRNATVIATTTAHIAALMGWELRELVDGSPVLRQRLEAIMASRTPPA
jgi:CRP/FNR family transcriptional regulator, cyclic AMP receptor protein